MRLIPVPELIIVALIALVILGPRTLWAVRRDRVRRR
jgi:Sec-independent protein translocase protein TatA